MDDIKAIRDARKLIDSADDFQTWEYSGTDDWISAAADAMASLLDALEAAQRDAARYRWLRDTSQVCASSTGRGIATPHYTTDEPARIKLDAAIDAAMSAAPQSPAAAQSTP